ncbi:MAG: 50S ribosomal protein L34 [Bacilli bacterium]|nr:50S ribosomal protein L34 [Bacilli bacterium]
MSKRTFQPNTRRRSKKMGFFARIKTNIIKSRRKKGRKVLSR